jgi:hypothetical protein
LQDIKWGQFSKEIGQPSEKLRNILGANVMYPPPPDSLRQGPSSFRHAVEIALRKAETVLDDFSLREITMDSSSRGLKALAISSREKNRLNAIKEFYNKNFC